MTREEKLKICKYYDGTCEGFTEEEKKILNSGKSMTVDEYNSLTKEEKKELKKIGKKIDEIYENQTFRQGEALWVRFNIDDDNVVENDETKGVRLDLPRSLVCAMYEYFQHCSNRASLEATRVKKEFFEKKMKLY